MAPLPVCCWGSSTKSSEAAGSWRSKVQARKVNDSLYELHDPPSSPSMIILFFHGLYSSNSSDMHLSTWENEDASSIWPESWLAGNFPGARILYVSYNASVGKNSQENFDMHVIGENLASDLLQASIGQTSNCPIIMVGYCFGGLVIKQVCLHMNANQTRTKFQSERMTLESFLGNIKGVFNYGTPHKGSPSVDRVAQSRASPLLKYFKTLSKEASRLNFEFSQLCKVHSDWQIQGLGESIATKWGIFRGVVVAPEACARDGDKFNILAVDHMSISKPPSEQDRRFYALTALLSNIAGNLEAGLHGHQCQGLPSYPIALDERGLDCEERLKSVAILGIVGMGGIGKTTLAKQIYNNISKQFEYTCFAENVKGDSHTRNYLLELFYQHDRRANKIEWLDLKYKKVLIVMDDVDSQNQLMQLPKLHDMGTGSRIIITSRDRDVLKFYENFSEYEVDFLEGDEAKKLFCQHAFGGPQEIPDHVATLTNHLEANVTKVVDKCSGLPLTLEVMGRLLRGHEGDAEVWEETIDKLGKAQAINGSRNDRVWASLKVSYDALVEEEQEMFIEAGTYFFEKPLERALAAWSTTAGNSKTRWANLVSRSMVKEVRKLQFNHQFGYFMEHREVWLHEQLRDLATSLAKGYMKSGSGREADELVSLLNAKQVKAETRILKLRCPSREVQWRVQCVELNNLKYLEFHSVGMHEGLGKNFPRKLSILIWQDLYRLDLERNHCFTISLNEMDNLAILELGLLEIQKGFVEALGNLKNLRILSLSRITGLDRLPENLDNLARLKQLELEGIRLQTLPQSLGNLKALEYLSLDKLDFLELPESFGDLSSLVSLRVKACKKLANLPKSFGRNLKKLKNLCIQGCPLLCGLPQSFSRLSGLQQLAIYNCESLKDLGDSFGNLPALRLLTLNSTGIERLPKTFGLLSTLEELTLGEPGPLKALPDNFGELKALKILDIAAAELETLPESFCRLTSLQNLTILSSTLAKLPENLGDLSKLEKLHLVVDVVKDLPESLGKLSSVLERLTIYCESLESLPASLGQLSSLQHLWVYCPRLEKLPDNLGELSSLQKLAIGSMKMNDLPKSTVDGQFFRFLYLRAESMSTLPDSIGELSNLPEFQSSSDWHDRMLHEYDNYPSSTVVIFSRLNPKRPQGVHSLPPPKELTFGMQRLESLPEKLGKLTSLRKLTILNCNRLEGIPESLGHIPSLREIHLDTCASLKSLPGSWGRPFSSEMALLQGESRNKIMTEGVFQRENRHGIRNVFEKPFPKTSAKGGVRLDVNRCPYLSSTVLRRSGWVEVRGENSWLVPHYSNCRGRCCGMYTRGIFS